MKTKQINRSSTIKKVCSPHKQNNTLTCFSKESLLRMIKYYNAKASTEKNKVFPGVSMNKIKEKPRNELWKALHNKFKDSCNDERCWKDTYFSNKVFFVFSYYVLSDISLISLWYFLVVS